MKPAFLRLAFAFSAALGLAAAPAAAAAGKPVSKPGGPGLVDPFERTRTRIDQLLKARIDPEPLPAVLPNPFALPVSPAALTAGDDLAPGNPQAPAAPAVEPLEPGGDAEILAAYLATLRISGSVRIDGQLNFIINQRRYKEGDEILMDKRDPKSTVKIEAAGPGTITFVHKTAKQVVRLRN